MSYLLSQDLISAFNFVQRICDEMACIDESLEFHRRVQIFGLLILCSGARGLARHLEASP